MCRNVALSHFRYHREIEAEEEKLLWNKPVVLAWNRVKKAAISKIVLVTFWGCFFRPSCWLLAEKGEQFSCTAAGDKGGMPQSMLCPHVVTMNLNWDCGSAWVL